MTRKSLIILLSLLTLALSGCISQTGQPPPTLTDLPAPAPTVAPTPGSTPVSDEQGLRTKWLLADVSNMDGAVTFARSIWKEESIRPYLGPLAIHSWDSDASDVKLTGIRDFAEEEGLEVWVTEGGWGAFLWNHPEIFPSWENAFNLAITFSTRL